MIGVYWNSTKVGRDDLAARIPPIMEGDDLLECRNKSKQKK